MRFIRSKTRFHRSYNCLGFSSYYSSRSIKSMPRETDSTDLLIVGGGPAGLSAAIRMKQLCKEKGKDYRVMVLEKGGEIGSHILSGAVIDPIALNELIPDWKNHTEVPVRVKATSDHMLYLTKTLSFRLPTVFSNTDRNYIISLSNLTKWLATQAEALGVEIYPGIAGSEVIYNSTGTEVIGVATNDVGIDKESNTKDNFQRGLEIRAKLTMFAEGCRGSLSKSLMSKFSLRQPGTFQTYGIGLKEIWEVNSKVYQMGKVIHTLGWPLNESKTYGGGFIYHDENNKVDIGLVVGLDYSNPYLNPYKEFQKFKEHPKIKELLSQGKCIAYGARALNEGGYQSIPKLYFPGGVILGCSAGFLNVPKIKGSHAAMKSGMIASEALFDYLSTSNSPDDTILLKSYEDRLKDSWVVKDLWRVRNIRPAFKKFGLYGGLLYSGLEIFLLKGYSPWTFKHHKPDHECLLPVEDPKVKKLEYGKPNGELTFSLLENLSRSGTNHEENQPCHLQLKNPDVPVQVNLKRFDGPESKYCPAGVYEFVETDEENKPRLVINAQNCLHCKTCDIKDPTQNIEWVTPEGGGGPQYNNT